MNKNDIRVEEETVAVIIAAVSACLGHGDFEIRSVNSSVPVRKQSPVSKKSQFVSWKTNN